MSKQNSIISKGLEDLAQTCIENNYTLSQATQYINRKAPKGVHISQSSYQRYRIYYNEKMKLIDIEAYKNDISKEIISIKNNLLISLEDAFKSVGLLHKQRKRFTNILDDVLYSMDRLSLTAESIKREADEDMKVEREIIYKIFGKYIKIWSKKCKIPYISMKDYKGTDGLYDMIEEMNEEVGYYKKYKVNRVTKWE